MSSVRQSAKGSGGHAGGSGMRGIEWSGHICGNHAMGRSEAGVVETVEKDHGRIETRRYWAFNHLECLSRPEQGPDLRAWH